MTSGSETLLAAGTRVRVLPEFDIPPGEDLIERMERVYETLGGYLDDSEAKS